MKPVKSEALGFQGALSKSMFSLDDPQSFQAIVAAAILLLQNQGTPPAKTLLVHSLEEHRAWLERDSEWFKHKTLAFGYGYVNNLMMVGRSDRLAECLRSWPVGLRDTTFVAVVDAPLK